MTETKQALDVVLLNCPFCGNAPELETTTDPDESCNCVRCDECDFELMGGPVGIGWWPTPEAAIKAWNTRDNAVRIRQLEEQVEQLQAALGEAREDVCVALVADIRFACGDNGKRMQPELVEFIRELAADAAKWRTRRKEAGRE